MAGRTPFAVIAALLLSAGCGVLSSPPPAEPSTVVVVLDVSESVIRGGGEPTLRDCLGAAFTWGVENASRLVVVPVGTVAAVPSFEVDLRPGDDVEQNKGRLAEWSRQRLEEYREGLAGVMARSGGSTTDLTAALLAAKDVFRSTDDEQEVLLLVSDLAVTEGASSLNQFAHEGEIDLDGWSEHLAHTLAETVEGPLKGVTVRGVVLPDGSSDLDAPARDRVQDAWLTALGPELDVQGDVSAFSTSARVCSELGDDDG